MWKTAGGLDPSIFGQLFAFIVVTTKMGLCRSTTISTGSISFEFFMGFLSVDYVII
jgi:hypothetical protein